MQQPTPYQLPLETYLEMVEGQLTLQRGFRNSQDINPVVIDYTQRILWHYLDTIKGCKTGNKPPVVAAQEVLALHWEAAFDDPEYLT
jgi:hypothetical protein